MVTIPGTQIASTALNTNANYTPKQGFDLAAIGGQAVEQLQKYQETVEVQEYNNLFMKGTMEINKLQNSIQSRNDYQNFDNDFNTGFAQVRDGLFSQASSPRVRALLESDLQKLYVQKYDAVDQLKYKRQGEVVRASLSQQLVDLQPLIANATTDEERSLLLSKGEAAIGAAYAGGQLDAESAQKQHQEFIAGVDFVQAQRDLNADPENFDPTKYGGLSEQRKVDLAEQRLRELEKVDRRTEAQVKKNQEVRTFDMALRAIKGEDPPTLDEIDQAVKTQSVNPDQAYEIAKMTLSPPPVDSQPATLADLKSKQFDGTLTLQDVYQARSNLQLSQNDTDNLISSLTGGFQSNPSFERSKRMWEAQFEVVDPITKMIKPGQELNDYNEGLFEIEKRSMGGKENPIDVATELINKRKTSIELENKLQDARITAGIPSSAEVTTDVMVAARASVKKEYDRAVKRKDAIKIAKAKAKMEAIMLLEKQAGIKYE